MSASPASDTSPSPRPKKSLLQSAWVPLGIVVLDVIAQGTAWAWLSPDRTMQVFSVLYTQPAVIFLLLLWWTFLSGYSWRIRLQVLGVLGVLTGGFFVLVRVEDFTGEMIPILAWRWTETREQRLEQFQQSRAADSPSSTDDAVEDHPLEITPADWPEFRGARRDGIVRYSTLRRNWDTAPPKQLWKHPVGLGWASFAVVNGWAFTQEQHRDNEVIICYDVQTGREIWRHSDPVRFSEIIGGDGPRATPTIHDGRLYALGATGLLNCLDARTGKRIWSVEILDDNGATNIEWGMAGSPLVYGDVVVVNPGGSDDRSVVAYHRLTGERVWSAGRNRAGYTAPQLATLDGMEQVLIFHGNGIAGHDPQTGRELWSFPWSNQSHVNAAQPITVSPQQVFIGSGYATGSVLLEVARHDGADDWKCQPVWQTKQFRLKFNSAVYRDGWLYGLDEGILTCLNATDGKRAWKGGRYGYGQVLLVDDVLLIQAESGEVVLVEATPEQHRELSRFQAIEGKTWNHPVLYRGLLLVRNGGEAACYDVSAPEPQTADVRP